MKTKIYLLPLFMLFVACLHAQPKVSKIISSVKTDNDIWKPGFVQIFKYDENKRLIYHSYETGFPDEPPTLFWGTTWEYDALGRVVKSAELYKDTIGHILTRNSELTTYDENYCQFSPKTTTSFWSINKNRQGSKYVYSYLPDCKVDTMRIYTWDSIGENIIFTLEEMWTYQYLDNGRIVQRRIHYWDESTNTFWMEENINTKTYDDMGWLLEDDYSMTDVGPERYLYTWHPDGSKKTEAYYGFRHGEWKLYSMDSIEYEYKYNNEQQLVKQTVYAYYKEGDEDWQVNIRSTNYDYYCDNLKRTAYREDRISFYEYTEGANCHRLGSELSAFVFPNPASDILIIESPDFRSGDMRIRLFDNLGQEVDKFNISYRTESAELNVSQLSNGIYFLHLKTKGKFTTKKIVVAK